MTRFALWLLVLPLGCTRPALRPSAVTEAGTLEAVRCGDVTALWRGKPPEAGAPLEFFVESLSFRFADGAERRFEPAGEVQPPHRSFEVFSPDCAFVALAQDSTGPYHLIPAAGLADYLDGRRAPMVVKPPSTGILTELRWLSATRFEFFASCCGGVEVFQADVTAPDKLERVYFAAEAPAGIRRTSGGGFELR